MVARGWPNPFRAWWRRFTNVDLGVGDLVRYRGELAAIVEDRGASVVIEYDDDARQAVRRRSLRRVP